MKITQRLLIILTISLLELQAQANIQSFINSEADIMMNFTRSGNNSHSSIDNLSSKKCSRCHSDIYEQWESSMHAKSTALKDPIHGLFYDAVVGNPRVKGVRMGKNKDKYPVCLECHSPAAAKEGKTQLNAKRSFSEGVNCIACHSLTKFKGTKKKSGGLKLGMKAYEYSSNQIQGPNGTSKKHKNFGKGGVANNPGLFKTSKVCLGCHDQRNNSKKVPLCQTGGEIISAGGSTTCQSCHMPVIEGISNHTMAGGHSAEMVSKGLVMTINIKKVSDMFQIKVNATNLLPHNFPTGAPFRNFYITVTAQNSHGDVLWQSSKTHPMKDDKQAMFMYIIGDDNNKPTSPPKATKVLGDTRLKPNETRVLNYTISSNGVAIITAKAYYDLLLVAIKDKFGSKLSKRLLEPKEIAKAIVVIE
ncbi:cytochrome c family protein [Candidatus Ruthia endofausta]|uniref:Cytochrome c family protein n=1 Tax=Candidatus Ruthia endofausta TaxID=2738852 RepID=A0A6N0HP65_9GAMM|nr:cytochrome c family protein [Candidatus Ruthia endofausta]QKQ24070.1 cytochrome c family protein [Candidatus Ruthia endofausta]